MENSGRNDESLLSNLSYALATPQEPLLEVADMPSAVLISHLYSLPRVL